MYGILIRFVGAATRYKKRMDFGMFHAPDEHRKLAMNVYEPLSSEVVRRLQGNY
jgi:hypothetical protein